MGKRILYGIDDYVKDKQAQDGKVPAGYEEEIRAATPSRVTATPQGGAGYGIRGGSVYIKHASEQQRKFLTGAVKAPEAEAETPSDGLSADTPMTQREMMYQNVVNAINSASQNLLDVMNRKLSYNEKSSPLYSILQKQYEREAEKAAGQAYAASVANTGGYGSSYATMAGEAARRQVMAGLDDQQLALYEAAKQEFEAERQSALDWYNTAVGMKAQAAQMVEEEKLLNAARSSGMNEDTYNLMIQAANEGWDTGTNKEALRARLNTIAAGNPEINVDAIMGRLTAETGAAAKDAANQFAVNPTVSGAAELMTAAKSTGEWETVQPEVSKSLADAYIKGIDTPDAAGALIGADSAAWSGMSDEERKQETLKSAGEAARDGVITADDYERILMADVNDMVTAIEDGQISRPATELSNLVVDWQNYRDLGYMSEETYGKLMAELEKTVDTSELIGKQATTMGESVGNFLDKKGAPEWLQKGAEIATDLYMSTWTAGSNLTKPISQALTANKILSNFDWYRRQINLTADQEKAIKELLSYSTLGGR